MIIISGKIKIFRPDEILLGNIGRGTEIHILKNLIYDTYSMHMQYIIFQVLDLNFLIHSIWVPPKYQI